MAKAKKTQTTQKGRTPATSTMIREAKVIKREDLRRDTYTPGREATAARRA